MNNIRTMDKNPVSILYVDDEEVLLDLAQKFLERMDAFSVRKASSVAEALELLASSPFDVIVSDYQMPATDGIEFLKQVKNGYPDLPFILFTGRGREEIVIQAINNGAAFYIQKGGDPTAQFTELAHKIRQAVSQARAEKALVNNFAALQHQERVIKERENFYRTVFENTGTAMLVIEEDLTISLANAECERMSGYSRTEVVGKRPWTDFVADEDRERMFSWHRQRRKSGVNVPTGFEFTIITRSGEHRRIFGTVALIPGTKTSVASLVDITNNIQIMDALKKAETLHRTIFEISPDPIAVTDLEGRLVRTSPSALDLFGLESEDQALGRPLFDWIDPEKRNGIEDRVLAFIRTSPYPASAQLYPLVKNDGTRFYAEISSSVLMGSEDNPVGMVSILRDVSDRIEAENALKRANEKLGLLATITQHDIRNQLTVLLGYIRLAQGGCESAVLRDYLGKIRNSAEKIETQVQLFRDYQAPGMNVARWQNVSDLINSSFSMLDNDRVGISDRSANLEIFADPLFGKAIHNILDNAFRHGKTLTGITIGYQTADPYLLLLIEDNGRGVPQGEKEKIFEMGYENAEGHGLFIAREILAITGMTIIENGIPGKGSCFTIRIPAGNFRFLNTA